MPFIVRQFIPDDAASVQRLVLGIQREEFGVPVTLEEQPDLRDVPTHYQKDHGSFWVAVDASELVGTIGLLDIGHRQGALRKMFVARSHRGAAVGVGAALLRTCLDWAATAGMTDVLLGTTEDFRAAHRFYEKWGFTEIAPEALPAHFPRMRLDTRFYRYHLGPSAAPVDAADKRGGA
jgi:GNAT superfamily N-acetyltransferase